MAGERAYALSFRNRSSSGHPGYYNTLTDAGKCVFRLKGSSCSAETGNPGAVFIGNTKVIKSVHLLSYSPVEAGISSVKADYIQAL